MIAPIGLPRNQKGFVLPVGLMFLAILCVLGATATMFTSTDLRISINHRSQLRSTYAAESGLEYGLVKMREAFGSLRPSLHIDPPSIDGIVFDELTIAPVGSTSTAELVGTFAGLTAAIHDYQITSKARIAGTNSSCELTMTVKDELIPLFQFGVFYQNDLEMLPGPDMTFDGGRIHSNSDIYLNSGNTFNIASQITSAGDLYRGRKDKVSTTGTVNVKDAHGNYQEMDFDSTSTNWLDQSELVWGHAVQSKDHGIYQLSLPTETGADSRDILGTGAGSLHEKSGLRIIDGVAFDRDGITIDLTDGGTKDDPISTATFYDQREEESITVTEVDMVKLQLSANAMDALNDPPVGGEAGIMYVSSSDGSESVRLTNGSVLPMSGLTVASGNPVYIQGDYNSATNSPAAVICDAVTILSNNWDDSNSSKSSTSDRIASDTTVNAAIIAGNKDTAGSKYSGGVENFPRFLEKWTGKDFNYSGSLICLWESQQAVGDWRYGDPVYKAPNRNWSYGMDLSDLPPGTPRVRNIEKYGWFRAMD